MTLEYATKLLRKETREEELEKLQSIGYDMEKIIDTINEAIELVCDYAERYEDLNK